MKTIREPVISIVEVAEKGGGWVYTDLNFAPPEPRSGPDETPWRQVAPLPSAASGLAVTGGGGAGRQLCYEDVTGSVTALSESATAVDRLDTRAFTADVDAPVAAGGSTLAMTAGRGPHIYYLDRGRRPVALAESDDGRWECLPCAQGPPASAVGRLAATRAGGTRHLYYLDVEGHLIEASWVNTGGELWSVTDLTSTLDAPPPGAVSPLATLGSGSDVRRVYYLDEERSLIELTYVIRPPSKKDPEVRAGWEVVNLSTRAGAPAATAAGPLTAALVDGSRPHVYYRDDGGRLIEMAWRGTGWQPGSPTESADHGTGAPLVAATGALAVTLSDHAASCHLFYLDPRRHLIHLHRVGGEWLSADLSTDADLPAVARRTPLAAIPAAGPRVYYLSEEDPWR
ncbi:hypothetical protein ACFQ7J_05100 [Streptomyces sp. NPDC056501]|uniref:hypothetical protein n=1 Tax=Streptomyces sp. NPDC056501 TaxID=3345841 RepID=UPI00367E6C33